MALKEGQIVQITFFKTCQYPSLVLAGFVCDNVSCSFAKAIWCTHNCLLQIVNQGKSVVQQLLDDKKQHPRLENDASLGVKKNCSTLSGLSQWTQTPTCQNCCVQRNFDEMFKSWLNRENNSCTFLHKDITLGWDLTLYAKTEWHVVQPYSNNFVYPRRAIQFCSLPIKQQNKHQTFNSPFRCVSDSRSVVRRHVLKGISVKRKCKITPEISQLLIPLSWSYSTY